jgi:excisionase family DNA binding protein
MAQRDDEQAGSPTKAGWRVNEWARDAGVSRSYTYELIRDGKLESVKAGSARIITTKPAAYLASLRNGAQI